MNENNTPQTLTTEQQLVDYAINLLGAVDPIAMVTKDKESMRQHLVEHINVAIAKLNATVPHLIECDNDRPCAFEVIGGLYPTFGGELHDPSAEVNNLFGQSTESTEPYAVTDEEINSVDDFIERKAAAIALGIWTYATIFAPTVRSLIRYTGEGIRLNLSIRPSVDVADLRKYEFSVFWWQMESTPEGGSRRSVNGQVSNSTFRPRIEGLEFYKDETATIDSIRNDRGTR